MKYSKLKSEFSPILDMLQLKVFEQDFSLKSDFSRRHLCPNPPALAGGRLSVILQYKLSLKAISLLVR
ncbi:hypothetical protein KM917_11970 [Virgibacillus pantothenticus]|nr:hypothetical protein [Virgibacillus pantothenticus]MBS7427697.1 hypothetical protein [Virgibacillus sp. 19R1-5]MBU8669228.1 hypothetical protein [Virgibacillus pantothenticus]MBU8795577.1 hypothetical protein [Virgibacillus pantothenticus]MEB5470040.1 hypothetical protein [Virgibacillus pantothenticus]MED3739162.1 hypothetical protein [Virgibacillus pantothenticus]